MQPKSGGIDSDKACQLCLVSHEFMNGFFNHVSMGNHICSCSAPKREWVTNIWETSMILYSMIVWKNINFNTSIGRYFRTKKLERIQWQRYLTDAIIMSFPAPAEPPMTATIKLGTMAKQRVNIFRIHGSSRKSRNPWNKKEVTGKSKKLERTQDNQFLKVVIIM